MHYEPLFTRDKSRKMAKLKSLSKNIFSASNCFMHFFIMSETYLQSAKKIQWKLLE